jgi:phosphatidylglycerophosphatase C
MRAVNGTLKTVANLAARAHRLVPALVRRDRDAIKALSSHLVFAGRAIAEVNNAGRIFCDQVIRWLREDTLDRLREHQANGDDVVLVSASYGAYLRPLGERLHVTGVIGTELVVDEAGCCTGALDGGNCRGDQKVVRLHAWLAEHRGGRDKVELWAYGDSAGDLAMLGDADHAVWLGDERKRPARMRTNSS